MQKKTWIIIIVALLLALIVAEGFIGKEYFNITKVKTPKPYCGIQQCHGVDLTCGYNTPTACTMEYQLGDYCKQYAKCDYLNNQCTLLKSNKFEKCVECYKNCDTRLTLEQSDDHCII